MVGSPYLVLHHCGKLLQVTMTCFDSAALLMLDSPAPCIGFSGQTETHNPSAAFLSSGKVNPGLQWMLLPARMPNNAKLVCHL